MRGAGIYVVRKGIDAAPEPASGAPNPPAAVVGSRGARSFSHPTYSSRKGVCVAQKCMCCEKEHRQPRSPPAGAQSPPAAVVRFRCEGSLPQPKCTVPKGVCAAQNYMRPSKREYHSNEFGRHEVVTPLSPPHGGRRLSGHGPGAPISRKGRGLERQRVTAPLAVSNVTDRMPGVPCGATHSTATSSSGFSTGSPSHSVTREAEPAMVRQLILRLLW